ncbi:hypothetical protein AMTR_s00018p00086050 [Amborella trichopoda]|uniref:Uncharacterized protein n=1 Tax=Amborella trichopoda TaxID=13333 RepID=W1PLV0_AMBTC|nr:hypothetical protein AMTR_s00018p00086050 [Amborella trichopoda]
MLNDLYGMLLSQEIQLSNQHAIMLDIGSPWVNLATQEGGGSQFPNRGHGGRGRGHGRGQGHGRALLHGPTKDGLYQLKLAKKRNNKSTGSAFLGVKVARTK